MAINCAHHPLDPLHTPSDSPIWIISPYKDQKSAQGGSQTTSRPWKKIDLELQPIFTCKKIIDDLRETELKPPLVTQQSVVYEFRCNLCDTNVIAFDMGRMLS